MPAQPPKHFSDDVVWYCLHVRPKQEAVTARMLRTETGVEVFSPLIRFKRPRRNRVMWVTESLFPGYVFARFCFATQHRHIRATSGVTNVVSFGGVPSIVDERIVSELRASIADNETVVIESEIRPGDEVKLVSGPFSGVRAVVTRLLPARQRVAILLELLGMEREVEISAQDLLPDVIHPLAPR